MNTSNLSIVCPPVGQFAKTPIFLLKPNENGVLRVGRHQSQTAHASERTHERVPAPDMKIKNTLETDDLTAMKSFNQLFSGLLSTTKVVFHNTLYVQQIEESYSKAESAIFLQCVQTFCHFRYTDRTEPLQNILLTNENDFLHAFKLMQQRKINSCTNLKPKTCMKAYDLLTLKFQNRTFSTFLLTKELYYSYKVLNQLITLFLLEQKIEFVKEHGGHLFYRLRTKTPFHYVTGN